MVISVSSISVTVSITSPFLLFISFILSSAFTRAIPALVTPWILFLSLSLACDDWRCSPSPFCKESRIVLKFAFCSPSVFVWYISDGVCFCHLSIFYRRDRASLNNSISILLVWRKIFKDERYAREKRVRNCFRYWSWTEQRWKENNLCLIKKMRVFILNKEVTKVA